MFEPHALTAAAEDYKVHLSGVTILELEIVPDKSGGEARITLEFETGRIACISVIDVRPQNYSGPCIPARNYTMGLMVPALAETSLVEGMETAEVENTLRQLCAIASAQRDRRKFRNVLLELREFLQEHRELLRSMSDDTFEALRRVWHS